MPTPATISRAAHHAAAPAPGSTPGFVAGAESVWEQLPDRLRRVLMFLDSHGVDESTAIVHEDFARRVLGMPRCIRPDLLDAALDELFERQLVMTVRLEVGGRRRGTSRRAVWIVCSPRQRGMAINIAAVRSIIAQRTAEGLTARPAPAPAPAPARGTETEAAA